MQHGPGMTALAASLAICLHVSACAQTPEPAPGAREGTEGQVPVPPKKPPVPVDGAYSSAAVSPDGLICKDPRLTGTPVKNVVGPMPGCGIYAPVKLTSIAGIKLTTPATLDCPTARTVANWLTGVADVEARRTLGARITKIWVMGSYSCRTRNNRPGARLSEHAQGRAIDIGGLWLGNGRKITVSQNWGKGTAGKFLRTIWKKACGPFKTVLGPDGDRYHQDHLHLDTAHRKRSFCR